MLEAYENGRLGPLRTDRYFDDGERGLGKIDTCHNHMTNIVEDDHQNTFWDWLQRKHVKYGMEVRKNGMYAERDFYDHFMAYMLETKESLPQSRIDHYRLRYPFSGDIQISIKSYLRHWSITQNEFISRYLPEEHNYRCRFIGFTRYRFKPYASNSAKTCFTDYVKFAMKEV
ncbi:hypothetical protein DFH28DRAFT_501040 [Melampsora americana]|nr:hypothetical protein DFH28DRAFT_501040 [Melampsora americana]